MKLRLATLDDDKLLLKWRNDPITRISSHNKEEVKIREHIKWLRNCIVNPNQFLFIAEKNDIPIGTIRADLFDETYELSWMIAPEARGKGLGKQMVIMLARILASKTIRAEIKRTNRGSIRIALYAGMKFSHRDGEILHFSRPVLRPNKSLQNKFQGRNDE
jgi:RimJ/RimL family protein N-acetyltransferase